MIAEVLVDVKAHQVNRTFDYIIPMKFSIASIGCRCIVPFGPRKVMGFIVNIKETSEYKGLKDICDLLDINPCISSEMLEISKQMAITTNSFLVTCLEACLPNALLVSYNKKYKILNKDLLSFETDKNNGEIINLTIPLNEIKREVDKNNLEVIYECNEKGSIKNKKSIKVKKMEFEGLTPKQSELLDFLLINGDVDKKDILEKFSRGILNALIEKDICEEIAVMEYREITSIAPIVYKKVVLNSEQQYVYDTVIDSLDTKQVFLLHGVTGSGKTEVYLDAIEEVIRRGKDAILLVPEISLTPQMVNRLKGRFSDNVAVFHSGLSMNERYDEWRKINNGLVSIVVGARSAIFSPLKNIGLIIIDEAHESSYQQDTQPRYNSKDIAIMRSNIHNCPIILGSATPSVVDYTKALNGEYQLIEIKNRANNQNMPKTNIVNMGLELTNGNKSPFSMQLIDAINERIEKKEQVMLLINRRGYSSFVMCRSCGETIKCPHCDVTLTYHETGDYLKCHYCNYQMPNVKICPSCSSKYIKYVGVGTEKIMEEATKLFPKARLLRMDQDTTTKKGSHEEILYKFGNKEADILVGTQMIAKGLDFPNVTLVGILLADLLLKMPDFRSSEKTFDLINQVSGRAGRHELKGEVIIQTYNQNHYSIKCAADNNYQGFYEQEMKVRKIGKYTPYYNIVQIIFIGFDSNECFKEANKTIDSLDESIIVLGPSKAIIGKINNKHRIVITLRYLNNIDSILNKLNEKYANHKSVNIHIEKQY